MNGKQVHLTKEGLDTFEKELAELKEVKRPKVVDRLSNARLQGDLSENSDYHNAKDELVFLDGRISELEDVLRHAILVKHTKSVGVSLGTKVTLRFNGNTHIYEIVGEWEADPMKKKVSDSSPLGQALIGKKIGDRIDVEAPAGKISYEVISIE